MSDQFLVGIQKRLYPAGNPPLCSHLLWMRIRLRWGESKDHPFWHLGPLERQTRAPLWPRTAKARHIHLPELLPHNEDVTFSKEVFRTWGPGSKSQNEHIHKIRFHPDPHYNCNGQTSLTCQRVDMTILLLPRIFLSPPLPYGTALSSQTVPP